MNNWKKMLALLLALAMIFALAACGESGKNGEGEEEEHVSSRRVRRDEQKEAEPTAEPTPEPTEEPKAEAGLVGEWTGTMDLTEQLAAEIQSGLGDTGLDFIGYLKEPFALELLASFDEDGHYRLSVDEQSFDKTVESFQASLKDFFMDLLLVSIKQSLAENGTDVSGIETMEDVEKLLGSPIDEIVKSSLGMDVDTFVNELFNKEMLQQSLGDMQSEGSYTVDGDMLRLSDSDDMRFALDGDTLTLEVEMDGDEKLPVEFHRVG